MINLTAVEFKDPRLEAYTQTVHAHGLEEILITTNNQRRPEARRRIKEFLESTRDIDAILCLNDEMAIGCYRGLCDLGMSIPDDIAVVGFDGIEDTEYHYHPISTVAAPVSDLCRQALHMVQERIRDPHLPLRHVNLTPELIIRESSRKSETSVSRLNGKLHGEAN